MEKFLADESVDFRIITHLRDGGYDIEAVVEVNPSISDEDVLEMANDLEAILITEDKDFGELSYRMNKPNQGIILIRLAGVDIEERKNKIQAALENFLEDFRGKFTVISKNKIRIKDQ